MIQSEQIHLLRVCISLSFPSLTPRVAVVIHDDRGGTDAAALGAVPVMTLIATVTRAVQALVPPNTLGYFSQAAILHACCTFCLVSFADQYFIFVYPLSAAITRLAVLKKGRLFVEHLVSF